MSLSTSRTEQLRKALFRGEELCLSRPQYLQSVRTFLDELLSADLGSGDVTVAALGLPEGRVAGRVFAKEPGVVAGMDEYAWFMARGGIVVTPRKADGDVVERGETVLEIEGQRGELLSRERVGLNLLQRLSGIATMTRRFQELAHRSNPQAQVVGTRKTPWGLLDKRAIHLGGGGTHRLGLGDAILVKNNHLALLADREEEAVGIAATRAWTRRQNAAFVEVEVRSEAGAIAAAHAFRELQEQEQERAKDSAWCPCLLMLDNMPPQEVSNVLAALRREDLLQRVLIEVSGKISEFNLEAYAACGVDAISLGALTHSAQALDFCQRLS